MKKIGKNLILTAAVLIIIGALRTPSQAHALNIIPMSMELYSTSGTPVYAAPDVFSQIVVYLDRFTNVRVTGITENGFYQVDLNGAYYIPGVYLVTQIEPAKTAKQLALEDLGDFAQAYRTQLEMMESYSETFALKDVTGDGVPEIIDAAGREIYTYYNERAVMMYYSDYPVTFYYSKNDNKLLGKYKWNDKEIWEVYNKDVTLLPWGQFKCVSTAASAYTGNASTISRDYTNDAETRADMYEILKEILSL